MGGTIFLPTSALWANPSGEQVVGGSATFDRQGNTLTVNQATTRLAVNWQDFSIAAGERTHFNMPSAASIALNRVLGGNPSQIYGTLSSNGNIILVNNAGIFVGPGGVVNAASFVGSTLDIDPHQFMNAGQGMHLTGDSYAPIVNQGNITAEKGDVFLIAQKVENRGTISAPNGRAALVGVGRAAERTEVVLHEVGGSGFAVRVAQLEGEAAQGMNGDLPDGEELLNEGEIAAAQAELNASGNIYALAIKNTGTIRAKAVVAQADGTVRLDGGLGDVRNTGTLIAKNAGAEATAAGGKIEVTGQNVTASPESIITAAGGELGGSGGKVKIDSADTTIVQGKVDVAAPSAGAKGGKVELLGERVGLLDGAKVDASGGAGGGTVLVGGDYLGGQTPSADLRDLAKQEAEPVKNAKATVMADTAEIKADATVNGDGGKIILWSDEYTGFYGDLFARGGVQGGNGGFIETSSKDNLQAIGVGVASAANGIGGLWLLDPANVELAAATADGSFSGGTTDPNIFTPTGSSATVNVATINSSLNSGTSVTIQTGFTGSVEQGNIIQTADGAISKTAGAAATLTLQANGSITLTQDITSTSNALDLVLAAGSASNFDTTVDPTSAINLQANLTLNGGNLVLNNSGTGGINQTDGAIVTTGQTAIAGAGGVVTLTQAGNNFGIIGGTGTTTQITDLNGLILSGSTFSGPTTITAGGSISQAGLISVSAGGLTLSVSATGSNIDLSTSANSIAGGVTIGGTATNVQDFKLRNVIAGATTPVNFANMTNLRDLTIFYDTAAFVIPNLQQAQATLRNISITANGGTITQNPTGGIVASGAASFTSSGAITVANPGNDFGGAVSAATTGANAVSLLDTDDLTLGVISMGSGALNITFGKDLLTNSGLSLDGRIVTGGVMNLTPTALGSDIILGANAGNANDIGGAVTITLANNGNVRDFVLRNVNSAAGAIGNLAGAANLRDVSINYPVGTYTVPTFTSSSFRDLSVYANTVILGGPVTSSNGSIELYQANAGGLFTVGNNINTLAGSIRILSDGNLTVSNGVVVGSQTTGSIELLADAAGSASAATGTLNLAGTATIGNANNANTITLQAAAVTISPTASLLQGAGTVILNPSTLTAPIDLGAAGVPPADFNVTSAELGRIFSSGTVQVGAESQVGNINIANINLTANTFGILNLVGSSASSARLAADATLRTFGIGLNLDVNVDLDDNLLVIDTTQGGFYPAGGDITFQKQVDSDRTLANSDGRISLDAGSGGRVLFAGTVGGNNPVQFLQVNSADSVTVGRVTARFGGSSGPGGLISLSGNTVTVNGVQNVDGISIAAGPGVAGGQVLLSGKDVILNNRITANGGDGIVNLAGANFGGGSAGEISIRATDTLSVNPASDAIIGGSFSALGGNPSGGNAQNGADGIIRLESDRDLYFTGNQEAERETQLSVSAGRNLIFASFLDLTDPGASVGGVSVRMNVDNAEVSKVPLNLRFAQSDSSGILYMAPGSSIQMNGGRLEINEGQSLTTGRIELANIDVVNTPSFGLIYEGSSVLRFTGSILGSNTQGDKGGIISISAPNAAVVVDGGITVNGVAGADAGSVSVVGESIDIGQIEANGGSSGRVTGRGGEVVLRASAAGIRVGSIFAQGGADESTSASGFGGSGGNIVLTPGGPLGSGRNDSLDVQLMYVAGGNSSSGVGGTGGSIAISSAGNLLVPLNMYIQGGDGGLFRGAPGSISVSTTAADADIAFTGANLVINGNGNFYLSSGRNLILGTTDFSAVDPLAVVQPCALTVNSGAAAGDVLGLLEILYGTANSAGQLVMPASSSIYSNGGDVRVLGNGGEATIGSIFTFLENAPGGDITIDTDLGGLSAGSLLVGGILNTQGGDGLAGTVGSPQGFGGGTVNLLAGSVVVGLVNTLGGNSSETAPLLGVGGVGGNISIVAEDLGGLITLRDNLVTTGGSGLSAGDGYGGAGGAISLTALGGVLLNSGDSSRTEILLNSSGGSGEGDGGFGVGGAITISGSLEGTISTSNTLHLVHGSGAVSLGSSSANQITLGTLITAADDPSSTGLVRIQGEMIVDSIVTFGRGYDLEILGGGTFENLFNPLNTGYLKIGNAGVATTFTEGLTVTAPYELRLLGEIIAGSGTSDPGIVAGRVVLTGDTTLNTAGSVINLGTIDSEDSTPRTLTLDAGDGATTITGAIGDENPLGAITVSSAGLTDFAGAITAESIETSAGGEVVFNDDLTLTDAGTPSVFLGVVTFNNEAFVTDPTSVLTLSGDSEKNLSGATITLSGGPITFGGAGNYTIGGLVADGSIILDLEGASLKTFNEAVELAGFNQAAGSGDVTFEQDVTTTDVSDFEGVVILRGLTFTAGDSTSFDALTIDTAGVTLAGTGAYTINGAVAGGQILTMNGAGAKTFGSTVNITGFTQVNGSGLVTLQGNTTTSGASTFNGAVTLSGITFLADGATVLGDSSTDAIILDTAGVTLRGAGAYTVNGVLTGAQTLTLDGAGTKTFASTANIGGFTQVDGTGLATFQGNVTTSGASTFNSLVTLSGISFSAGGATILGNAAGDTIALTTGAVTLGGVGAFTLNGAMAGVQALTLAGSNTKIFTSTVAIGNGTTAMIQANTAGNDVSFADNVTLNGASTFARQVTLDGMSVTASGATSLKTVVLSGGAVTLQGAGAYTTSGAVTGAQNFTLSGAGTKTFASTINSGDLTQTGGQIRLGGNVTAGVVDLENAATTSSVTVNSGGFAQTYDALTLGGSLTAQSGAGLTTLGTVGGAGNLSLVSDAVDLLAAVRNQGSFSAQTAGSIVLGGAYLSGVEVARIFSSGGANFTSTGGNATADTVTVNTSLSLNGSTGAGVEDTTVNGALNLITGGVASFGGTLSTARALGITAASIISGVTPGLLDLVSIPSLGNINLTGAGADFAYLPAGNLNLTGHIILNNGDIVLAPTGNFVNNFNGNPFTGASTRILTRDFFTYPNSAGVPGLATVFGVSSLAQLGANQIGVALPFLAGSAGPYITEFTTGTGQPYILATQENAVPVLRTPAAYTVVGAFPARVSYSEVELEMMTVEERSAYEAGQRRQSAKVILERQPGQPEIGAPTEGEIPQAKATDGAKPAPTAQVFLQGQPLAGRSEKETRDSTQLLRVRPSRVVSLRPILDSRGVLENERLAAEVNLSAAPIARIR